MGSRARVTTPNPPQAASATGAGVNVHSCFRVVACLTWVPVTSSAAGMFVRPREPAAFVHLNGMAKARSTAAVSTLTPSLGRSRQILAAATEERWIKWPLIRRRTSLSCVVGGL